jgi:predicted N-acyltransferase
MQPTANDPVITVLDSVDELGDAQWSALAGGRGFYASAPWHRFLESDPSHDAWYVVARQPDGLLVGVLPVYLHAGGPGGGVDRFYDPRVVFACEEPDLPSATMLLGGRAGYETQLLLRPGLDAGSRARVLVALVARCRMLAGAWAADGLASMYLTSAAAVELAPALAAGEPLITDVNAVIALDGLESLDGYLKSLSRHRRQRIAREIRDFEASSFVLRTGRLSESYELAGGLLAALHRRHGHADTPEILVGHLARQVAHLDELSRVIVCERAGVAVGFLLAYEWEGAWYARATGLADGLPGASSVLFNVAYYAAIREALERGMRSYDVGPSSLKTKLLRGARLQPRWSLVDVDGLTAVTGAAWNTAQLARWDAELAPMHRPVAAGWRRSAGLAPDAAGVPATL